MCIRDRLNAIAQVNARNIFIYPNNKNIILAANQARELTKDKNIIVIPTKTVPQGITAIINFAPEKSVDVYKRQSKYCVCTAMGGRRIPPGAARCGICE